MRAVWERGATSPFNRSCWVTLAGKEQYKQNCQIYPPILGAKILILYEAVCYSFVIFPTQNMSLTDKAHRLPIL